MNAIKNTLVIVVVLLSCVTIEASCTKKDNASPSNDNAYITLYGSKGDTLIVDSGIRSQMNGNIMYESSNYTWKAIGEPHDAISINTGTSTINGTVYLFSDTLIITVSKTYGSYMPFNSLMYKSYR